MCTLSPSQFYLDEKSGPKIFTIIKIYSQCYEIASQNEKKVEWKNFDTFFNISLIYRENLTVGKN